MDSFKHFEDFSQRVAACYKCWHIWSKNPFSFWGFGGPEPPWMHGIIIAWLDSHVSSFPFQVVFCFNCKSPFSSMLVIWPGSCGRSPAFIRLTRCLGLPNYHVKRECLLMTDPDMLSGVTTFPAPLVSQVSLQLWFTDFDLHVCAMKLSIGFLDWMW